MEKRSGQRGIDDIPRWSCGLWGISVSAAGVPAPVRGDMMAVAVAVVEGGMVGWSVGWLE